jgi:hypothetical protein
VARDRVFRSLDSKTALRTRETVRGGTGRADNDYLRLPPRESQRTPTSRRTRLMNLAMQTLHVPFQFMDLPAGRFKMIQVS